ncbi:MAG: heme-binding protein [Rhizobiaceae bacterium]
MSNYTQEAIKLTHEGALALIRAGMEKATAMRVPQCIIVVDASGEVLASVRMDGAKFLSLRTAHAKARTAAASNGPTGALGNEAALAASISSRGAMTVLKGGLPIRFGGKLAGGIGVGSGTGDEDVEVARAALAAIGADAL